MVFINDVYEMEEIRFMEEVQVIRKTITEEMLEKVYSRENYTVDESDSLTTVFFELTQRVFKAKERRDPSKQRIFNFLVNLNYVEIGLKCMAEISENLRNNAVHFINGMIIFTDISRRFMTERGALKCIVGHYHKDVRMPELVGSILFKNTEMIEQLVQNKFLHALGLATKNSNASSNANCNANYEYYMDKFLIKNTKAGSPNNSMSPDRGTEENEQDMELLPPKRAKLDVVVIDSSNSNSPLKSINDEGSVGNIDVNKGNVGDLKRKKLSKDEKEVRRLERERLKKEKEDERVAKKLLEDETKRKKEEEKVAKKREEDELKRRKEEERLAKKREDDEIKRKKEEERLAKKREKEEADELRRKKEEDRIAKKKEVEAKKEQDRLAKEAEALAKVNQENRQKKALLSFLIKTPKAETDKVVTKREEIFIAIAGFRPFFVKDGMRVAPLLRRPALQGQTYDEFMSPPTEQFNYLVDCKEKNHKLVLKKKKDKAKYYSFAENFRPPYYGTFRGKSGKVGGRRPLGQDEGLDYDFDSADEWEEEVDGDECRSDDETDKESDNEVDDDDGAIVAHGYLSNDEGCSDSDEPKSLDAKVRSDVAIKEWELAVEDKKKKSKSKNMVPILFGIKYFTDAELCTPLPAGLTRGMKFSFPPKQQPTANIVVSV
uniref:Calponin-homology (CH) domain-containing protein n=1 Tax=Rhabditophanes sp. KR3021 TaxID=114890 RepID=A0AC35TPX7_9BILA